MTDLLVFLRARLADDELLAQRQQAFDAWVDEQHVGDYGKVDTVAVPPFATLGSPADPARVLREVAAKRRIMAIHDRYAAVWSVTQPVAGARAGCCDGCGYQGYCDDPVVEDINDCPELRALAAVYSDHPDYREDWRA